MASTTLIASPEAQRIFRHEYLVSHLGRKVVFMIFQKCFLHGHTDTILDILMENGIATHEKIFNIEEINSLGCKHPQSYGVTLMNKICQFLWLKGVNDPGDELKQLVGKIKAERECVSHEEGMSENDLVNKIQEFQRLLEETLDKTKSFLPVHGVEIDELKAEIGAAVPELMGKICVKYDTSKREDVETIKKEMGVFWRECRDLVQKRVEEEFWPLYKTLCQISPFDLLAKHVTQDPSNFILSLKVDTDSRFNRNFRGIRGTIVNQQEIFNQNKLGDDPEVVIISGDAGSGKTTILCSFVEKWYKKINDIPQFLSFQVVLYIQFRNHEHDKFEDYIKSLLKETVKHYDLSMVVSHIIISKCLVLCDGYDEANENSKKLFEDMLTYPWEDVKIVVTTRPWNALDLTDVVASLQRRRVNLKVLGIQEKQFNSVIENISGCLLHDDQEREKIKTGLSQKIAEMSYRTKALVKTPLLFNKFVFIYVESPDERHELNTKASLHLQLKKNLAKRILEATGISEQSLEEFDELYRKWSLKYYIEKKIEWTERDVRSLKEEIRSQISSQDVLENFHAIMSSYFSIKQMYDGPQIVNLYCYGHRSEQEFAIAVDLCDEISARMQQGGDSPLDAALQSKGLTKSSVFDDKDVFKELIGVISFIPGILYQKYPKSDALYNQIKVIQKLYVTYSLTQNMHDEVLEPCIETRLDDQVLQSHASLLGETHLKKNIRFKRVDSYFALPPLMSLLKPRRLELEEIERDLSKLNVILASTVLHEIPTRIMVWIDLQDCEKFTGEISHSVDELRVDLLNFGNKIEDERSYPTSLMKLSGTLTVIYHVQTLNSTRAAEIVNRTYPTFRNGVCDNAYMLSNKAVDIRDLIHQLTIAPLRSVGVQARREDVGFEDLHEYCEKEGLGYLSILE
ncbi:uncharacterized protein LOC135209728 [Macrobrachium nipponense]|uniref:uncharacterized protein LOC135209728 n=1 Tax=Macrobrachium nipponense TaxID=159736 RepID=UPI0030C8685C